MNKRVLVLNHFAVPPGGTGGTRHFEMFSQVKDWTASIVAARTNSVTTQRMGDADGFIFVPALALQSNGLQRLANWCSYSAAAVAICLLRSKEKPHVVYASTPHLLTGVAGVALASAWRIPLVLEVRDLWPKVLLEMDICTSESLTYRGLAALESWLYRKADHIVYMAEGNRGHFLAHGVASKQLTFIPNASDVSPEVSATERMALRAHYGFERETFVYTGAHGVANGLELLLTAARGVQSGADVVLVGDGVEKRRLQRLAHDKALSNVRFLDPIPKAEIPALLAAADAGVHCLADVPLFRYGVSPNKVYDYMAVGLPVITNSPGTVAAIVNTAKCGLACEPNGLGEGLSGFMQRTEAERAEWSQNAREYLRGEVSRTGMAARLACVLNDVDRFHRMGGPQTDGARANPRSGKTRPIGVGLVRRIFRR